MAIDQAIDQWWLSWEHELELTEDSLKIWYNVSLFYCIVGPYVFNTLKLIVQLS